MFSNTDKESAELADRSQASSSKTEKPRRTNSKLGNRSSPTPTQNQQKLISTSLLDVSSSFDEAEHDGIGNKTHYVVKPPSDTLFNASTAGKRNFSQTELADWNHPSSFKSKKPRWTNSELGNPSSLSQNHQKLMSTSLLDASSSSDEAEDNDIGKTPYMVKPPSDTHFNASTAGKRNFSQNELADSNQTSSSKSKKPRWTNSKLGNPPSLTQNHQKLMSTSLLDASSSSDEAEDNDIGKTPYMVKPPSGTLFDASELEKFYRRYTRSLPDCHPVHTTAELQEVRYKFRKNAINKTYFCQFQYKKPPLLFIVTNAYGVFISTSDEYFSRSTIHDIRALQPRHRVSLLVPTIQHWWNAESKAMMLAFLEHFINDMKCLAATQQFRSAIERFGIVDIKESLQALRTKLVTATKNINGQTTPGVFGLRIENTFNIPSQIHVSLAEITGTTIRPSKWKKLIVPSYMHAALMIVIKGFKITKTGFSLDFNVESLAYMKVVEIDRVRKRSFGFDHMTEFKNSTIQSSSSEDEDNVNIGLSISSGSDKKFDTSMW